MLHKRRANKYFFNENPTEKEARNKIAFFLHLPEINSTQNKQVTSMIEIITTLASIAAFFAASYVITYMRRCSWKWKSKEMVEKVLQKRISPKVKVHDNHGLTIQDSINALPLAIQRYLHKALFLIDDEDRGSNYMMHTPIAIIKSVKLKQEGTILVNDQWLPFKATQTVFGSPAAPGLVWDCVAKMHPSLTILKNLNMFARDAYVDKRGQFDVNAMGLMPIVSMKGTANVNSGECMRWLAEIPLYPTAFLPSFGARVTWVQDSQQIEGPWSQHHGAFARGRLADGDEGITAEVQFCFGEDDLVSSVRAHRTQEIVDGIITTMPWEGLISEYKTIDGMLVPIKWEAGYWGEGKLQLYFKAVNHSLQYTYFD